MKNTISYKFSNGVEIKGTIDQVEKAAKVYGLEIDYSKIEGCPDGFYPSKTKGLVKISTMNDYHLRRAILKRAKDFYSEIYESKDDNAKFLKKFVSLTEDNIVANIFSELAKRK